MKATWLLLFVLAGSIIHAGAQGCSTCGGSGAGDSGGDDVGVDFSVSLGAAQYGQSAGELNFSSSMPNPILFTPIALQFDAPTRTDVSVLTVTGYATNLTTTIETNSFWVTNMLVITNGTTVVTNSIISLEDMPVTNVDSVLITNAIIRQVVAPQAVADIPPPPTANGYCINFYYPSQMGVFSNGAYMVSGTPFITWAITNTAPPNINQLQISEIETNTVIKQWSYSYSTNTGIWSIQPLGGAIQENTLVTNLDADTYQVIDTVQSPSGPVVQQVKNTYQIFNWSDGTNVALVESDAGSDAAPETTTYTYWDSSQFGAGAEPLIRTVSNPDGSWEYYYNYDTSGNPLTVYSSFGDITLSYATNNSGGNARETDYTYDPGSGGANVSGSGDDGTLNPNTARLVVQKINNTEVSRSYTVFPSVGVRLDIQCTAAGAGWGDSGNLITKNLFFTNGPNQFALQAVIRPDGTMTTYNYITNAAGTYQTNIIASGQPDSTYTYIVDGVSNQVVLNQWGENVSSTSWDVKSDLVLSQDTYGNYDNFGRPQQVAHLDGTTEYTYYACCGLESTIDRDGVQTGYLYDAVRRPVGYAKFFSSSGNPITWQNTLDAAGRVIQSQRIGTDTSTITMSQSGYDLAGELIAQTNALGGVTAYSRANDPTTGGLIRTIANPDGGTVVNSYYADGSLKSVTGTGVHGKAYGYGVEYCSGMSVYAGYMVETNLYAAGSLSSEWTKTYTDLAGRSIEVLYADGNYSQSFYNSEGQLAKQIDPDGIITLYQYNAKGELAFTVVDMNQDGNVDISSDRITQTTNDVATDHSTTVRRTRTYVWLDGQSVGTLVSSMEASTNGLDTWQTQYRDTGTAVTTHSQTVPGITRKVTITAPDGSTMISTNLYGRLVGNAQYISGTKIGGTIYGYDAHGRQNTMTDARNGTTTLGLNNADLVATNTTPNPGGGSPEVTKTTYNNMMQATSVTLPDNTTVSSVYLLTGELAQQSGSRIYPVEYGYDYAGRLQTMTNWSGGLGGAGVRVTTNNYDSQRGWLSSKAYADGNGPSYAYTPAGRLLTRTWVRGVTTTYAYDNAGGLATVLYSDSTPGVTNAYDRLGRLKSVVCNGMTDTLSYNLVNELLGESFSGGALAGLSVTNFYDNDLRRITLSIRKSSTQVAVATYAYDGASRLSSVTDGNNYSANYTRLANSPLVSQITLKQGSTTRMTTTKSYDYLNRLTSISSSPSGSGQFPVNFNYNYNSANQRTHNTLADGSYWVYGYDSLGQVTNACRYWSDGTLVAGQQFDYTFDTIGNRTQVRAGGDTNGANLRVANYTNNTLNQVTSRDVVGQVDIMGASLTSLTNSVTVNGQAAYRKQEYFRQQLPVNNTNSPVWTNIIVAATNQSSVTGHVFVAQEPEVFKYDADGNLTNDGRWAYTWDGENRLKGMTVNTNVGPQYQLNFAYDSQGRRIQKIVTTNGVAIYTNNFLYDGWNLIAETRPDNSLIRSYVWGTDLSGTSQGAGGVGGLLEISYYGSSTTNCFPAYDGNGNIMALVNAADGALAANYDYGPFGEVIRSTGLMAKNNPFRFSTKYDDDESDLLYYGYRYYKPSTGTWPSRDQLEELSFYKSYTSLLKQSHQKIMQAQKPFGNEFAFLNNQPINLIDMRGLTTWKGKCASYGVGWLGGYVCVECDLISGNEIGLDLHSEYVHTKAWFLGLCVGIPVGLTFSSNTFISPNGSDHTAFHGSASLYGFSASVGGGGYVQSMRLGDADLYSIAGTQTGVDVAAFVGVGHSFVSVWDVWNNN